ncbi:galactokinase [Fodinicola acaciae]|uniref:galactokinase n=1 Tax=Fodinicola acaciae TaxID=2681555 RepID=UPI0013D232A3|nr:galactokinase [Fodinicola acaciae]
MNLFVETYGRQPDGVWASPGRVNLIGEHTDYNEGFVLPFALHQRTVVAAGRRAAPGWTVRSRLTGETVHIGRSDLSPGAVKGWAAYVAGVLWALVDAGFAIPDCDFAVESDVPLGAGLSSSHSFECAVLTAVEGLGDFSIPGIEAAKLVQRTENVYVGAATGLMDQTASLLCTAGHALFFDCRSLEVEQVPLDLASDGLALLVLNTNTPHTHADGEYAERRRSCERGAEILGVRALRDIGVADLPEALAKINDDVVRRRVRHVVTENARVQDAVALFRAGRVREAGPLLTASHASMRDDFEITVAQVDTAVEAALRAGAYGSRMTGGGFGGCIIALTDTEKAGSTARAVEDAFAAKGFAAPEWFTAVPSAGATRLL